MAVEAANRAVEIAPNDAFVRGLVARAAWMACQPDLLRIETMRAIALNPNDPQNLGPLGNLMAYAGFWDEGVALAEKGIALTAPSTPRWWWWAIAKRAWAREDYKLAFDAFREPMSSSYGSAICIWRIRCHSLTAPRSQGARVDPIEDEARIHDPRGGGLLQNVVLRAFLSRKDAGSPANRWASCRGLMSERKQPASPLTRRAKTAFISPLEEGERRRPVHSNQLARRHHIGIDPAA